MKFHTIKFYIIWFLGGLIFNLYAQESSFRLEEDQLPPVPKEQTAVYDYAGILSARDEALLKQKLLRYADTTSTQIVIATVPKLPDVDFNYWVAQWGEKWGIGSKGKDNGILIVVAPNDRKVAIQTGYGVEDRLTDALSRRIIENIFIPYFKIGDYYQGLDRGTGAIMEILSGKFKAEKKKENETQNEEMPDWLVMLIILLVLFVLIYWGSRHSGNGDGGYTIDRRGPVIWGSPFGGTSGGFGGGFGGGSWGGGGFSGGFGGGSFGGGGASGSW